MAAERFGPYELIGLLGRGGMGEVHRAVDTRKNRGEVALKRLPAGLAADADFQRRFLREAELAARLRDPHVIPIHDYGQIDGQPYLDMRLVDGTDLATHLARHGPLDPGRAVAILEQVAGALDAAHGEGLVHRDVKPQNVLLARGAGPDFAYLIDFGIAANLLTSTRSSSMVAGTAAYMAPERFSAGGDHRVDVYALGAVLFELLTGRTPFAGDFLQLLNAHVNAPPPRPSDLRPGLPPALDHVVTSALAKDPDRRPSSAGALAEAARRAVAPPPAESLAVTAGAPREDRHDTVVVAEAPHRPRRTILLAGLATLVVVAAVIVAANRLPGATATATDSVPGAGVVTDFAIATDGRRGVVNSGNGVAALDLTAGTSEAPVPVAGYPEKLAVSPDGRLAYTTSANSFGLPGGVEGVTVIDLARHVVTGSVPVPAPRAVAVAPDGRAYVASSDLDGQDTVSVIDPATMGVVARIPLDVPTDVRVTPDGRQVYVNAVGGTFVIDTASNTVVATVPARSVAVSLQISHDGRSAYRTFADSDPNTVSSVVERIDTATRTVRSARFPGRCSGCGLALSPDDRDLYILGGSPGRSDAPSSQLTTLDPATFAVAATRSFDQRLLSPDIDVVPTPDGAGRAYFALGGSLRSLEL